MTRTEQSNLDFIINTLHKTTLLVSYDKVKHGWTTIYLKTKKNRYISSHYVDVSKQDISTIETIYYLNGVIDGYENAFKK